MIEIEKPFVIRTYNTSSGDEVEVVIAYPEKYPEDWCCYHSIKWGRNPISIKKAPGIDALDALFRSIKMVELKLIAKSELLNQTITWDGNSDIGLSP